MIAFAACSAVEEKKSTMDTLREFTAGLHTICTTILSFWGHVKHIEEGSPDPDLTKEVQPDDEGAPRPTSSKENE